MIYFHPESHGFRIASFEARFLQAWTPLQALTFVRSRDSTGGFQSIGLRPVIIHFRLGFSMIFHETIQRSYGVPPMAMEPPRHQSQQPKVAEAEEKLLPVKVPERPLVNFSATAHRDYGIMKKS